MKGKIIAKIKDEKMDIESKDQWMSYENESLDDFKNRMKEGGSDPNNYNFTDPIDEEPKKSTVYAPIIHMIDSIKDDLMIAFFAKELGLLKDGEVQEFLKSAVNTWKETIPTQTEDDIEQKLSQFITEQPLPPVIEEMPNMDEAIEEEKEEADEIISKTEDEGDK